MLHPTRPLVTGTEWSVCRPIARRLRVLTQTPRGPQWRHAALPVQETSLPVARPILPFTTFARRHMICSKVLNSSWEAESQTERTNRNPKERLLSNSVSNIEITKLSGLVLSVFEQSFFVSTLHHFELKFSYFDETNKTQPIAFWTI